MALGGFGRLGRVGLVIGVSVCRRVEKGKISLEGFFFC